MSYKYLKVKNSNLKKIRQNKSTLIEELQKLRLIYSHIPAAIIVLKPDFEIVSVNNFVKKFVNCHPDELIGKTCYKFIGNGEVCTNCPVQKTIETRLNQWNLKKEPSPSGGIQYISQRSVPIFKNGQIINLLEIIVDRTEQEQYKAKIEKEFFDTIEILISLIEIYDGYTGGHSNAVKIASVLISKSLNLSETDIKTVEIAAVLHDIGKIGINCSIINKNTTLTDFEFEAIKKHPVIGEGALKYVDGFENSREIIRHHHERYNGTGYPDGLKGEEIPLGSRILAIADAYEAMTSNRPYRNKMSHEKAINELVKNKGVQFDPNVLEIFLKEVAPKIKSPT